MYIVLLLADEKDRIAVKPKSTDITSGGLVIVSAIRCGVLRLFIVLCVGF